MNGRIAAKPTHRKKRDEWGTRGHLGHPPLVLERVGGFNAEFEGEESEHLVVSGWCLAGSCEFRHSAHRQLRRDCDHYFFLNSSKNALSIS